MRSARVRTPFDSAVELNDLLEDTRARALRYGRPGALQLSRPERGFGRGSRRARVAFSPRNPAGRPLIPFRAGLATLVLLIVELLPAWLLAPAF